jgi:hypothetical protein
MVTTLIGLAVFLSAFMVDAANARYVQAVNRLDTHRAAGWSVMQWTASVVGFVVAVKISFWMLPVEALGLYAGTWYSLHKSQKACKLGT